MATILSILIKLGMILAYAVTGALIFIGALTIAIALSRFTNH